MVILINAIFSEKIIRATCRVAVNLVATAMRETETYSPETVCV